MPVLQRPAAEIAYLQAGQGTDTLLFIHGALCDHSDWREQLAFFEGTHRVVAPDLQGHGRSSVHTGLIGVEPYARDMAALIEALGLQRVWLVAHSMGCRVALRTSELAAQQVAGLVLIDGAYLTPCLLTERTQAEREALAQAARERGRALYEGQMPAERAQRGFSQMFFDPRMNAERDRMIERARRLPAHVARELMPDFAAWDLLHMEPTLLRVKVPVLALLCTYMNSQHERVSLSPGMTTPWIEALQTLTPQARLVRYEGSGHFPMLERPEAVNREILDFIARAG